MSPSMFNNSSHFDIYGGEFTMEIHMVSLYSIELQVVIHTNRMNRKRTSNVCALPTRLTIELLSVAWP